MRSTGYLIVTSNTNEPRDVRVQPHTRWNRFLAG